MFFGKLKGNYLKIDRDKSSEEQLREAEEQIKDAPVEIAIVFGEGGYLFAKEGSEMAVSFNERELSALRGKIVTHNHPSGSPVSIADVLFAAAHDLVQIRTVAKTMIYVIRRPQGNWNFEGINELFISNRAYLETKRLSIGRDVYDAYVDGQLTEEGCQRLYAERVGEFLLAFMTEKLDLEIDTQPI